MNGYLITATGTEALEAFGRPGVRHAAALDSGEGFIAFDGPVPAEGECFELVETWLDAHPKVRFPLPAADGLDTYALFDSAAFRALPSSVVRMASLLSNDLILAVVTEPQASARWSATETGWLDVRIRQAVAV